MDSDRHWWLIVLLIPILILLSLFGIMHDSPIRALGRSLDNDNFDYNSVTEIDQNPDIPFMDYPLGGPSSRQEASRARLELIKKDLDESMLVLNKQNYKIKYDYASRKNASINFKGLIEPTPQGNFQLTETRSKDNPWLIEGGVTYEAQEIKTGRSVTVAYFRSSYNGNSARKECEISKLICTSNITVCPLFCSTASQKGESMLVTDKIGRGLFMDLKRRPGQRFTLIEALYAGKQMTEKLRIMFDDFGLIHTRPDLSYWFYKNPDARLDPQSNELILMQLEGRTIYIPDLSGTTQMKRTPKGQTKCIIDNMMEMVADENIHALSSLNRYSLTLEEREAVERNLREMLAHYTMMNHDERPPFETFVNLIQESIRVLEDSESRSNKNPAGF